MKKIIQIAVYFTLSGMVMAADGVKKTPSLPVVNIEADAGFGYVIGGKQIQLAHDSLNPTPDYYVDFMYGVHVMVMPGQFGLQAGFSRNLFRAASLQAGGGYSVYTYDTIDGGFNYAIPLETGEKREGRAFLILGAGLNYSMLQYADQFKSDLQASAAKQGRTLIFDANPATGLGGYAQVGYTQFLSENLFFSLSARVNYVNAKFSGSTTALDGWALEIPIGFGVGF